ncbi:MAG: DAK2 domain-containing protein [Acidobacteriota bacterium]
MGFNSIDGHDLVHMLQAGCSMLEKNKAAVDALNVFPVPDGDTGTNMYLTLVSAVKEVEKNEESNIGIVGKALSMGSLMGARGNSGVILSQVFRGFAKEIEHKDTANAKIIAAALQMGSDTAYKAVMKPVEGTILTVVREVARVATATARSNEDIAAVLVEALEAGRVMLDRTPSMLPILKESGVVDSGGQGFLYLLEGMITALTGEAQIVRRQVETVSEVEAKSDGPLEFQYCTELLIRGTKMNVDKIRTQLDPLGDSMLVVGEEELIKVHIHSNHPGKVLEICLGWGELHDVKIDNMEEEAEAQREKLAEMAVAPKKKVGVVAVSQGEGWTQMLNSLGVDKLVSGGQTMNPSTEDLMNAINEVNAESVILLPNNKNVILAANQAQELSSIPVQVVATNSTMQAIAALVVYDPDMDIQDMVDAMNDEIRRVRSGEVTVAIRDSQINGLQIQEGDCIGLISDEVKVKADTIEETVMAVLQLIAGEGDLISLYYGQDVSPEQAEDMKAQVELAYGSFDIEVHYGGQPYYPYQISIE